MNSAQQPGGGAQQGATTETLPSGLRIPVKLSLSLSSEKSKVGDPVRLEVVADVHDNSGVIAIPRHSKLSGRVTYVAHYDRKNQPGMLSFGVDHAEWKGHSAALDAALFGTHVMATDSLRGEIVEGIKAATLRHGDSLNVVTTEIYTDVQIYGNRLRAGPSTTLHTFMQLRLLPDHPAVKTAFVKDDGDVELPDEFFLVLLNGMKVVN